MKKRLICERVNIYEDRLDTRGIFQSIATKVMNNDFIKINKESDITSRF